MSLRFIGDFDKIDEVCCVAGNVVNGPTGAAIFGVGGALTPEDPFSYEVFNNFDSENDIENGGLSLQADYEMDFATLTSITSYRISDLVQNADSDFTSADIVGRNFNETNIDTFTQEVRLTSNGGERFDWMIGGFYFDEEVEIANEFFYGADGRNYLDLLTAGGLSTVESIIGAPVGLTFAQEGQGLTEAFGQENTAWSLFGTLDFHVTDRLTATVGLNYTSDEKDAFGRIDSTAAFSALDLVAVGNQVIFQQAFATTLAGFGIDATDPAQVAAFAQANPAGFAQVQAGAQAFADAGATDPAVNPLLGLQPVQFLPPFLNFPNAVENGQSDDEELTYTLRLAYDVNDDINVYASAATGFKATSWNLSRDSRPFASDFVAGSPVTNPAGSPIRDAGLAVPNLTAGTRFAGPEEATVYEIGLKAKYGHAGLQSRNLRPEHRRLPDQRLHRHRLRPCKCGQAVHPRHRIRRRLEPLRAADDQFRHDAAGRQVRRVHQLDRRRHLRRRAGGHPGPGLLHGGELRLHAERLGQLRARRLAV